MSPSPAAGKQQQQGANPKTPTKIARRPAQTPQKSAKATPKLGQTPQRSKQGAKGNPSVPKPAASTQQTDSDEPLTPTASKAENARDKAQQGKGPTERQVDEADRKLKQVASDDQGSEEGHEHDDDDPLDKVKQTGKGASDELQQAVPEPISDDDDLGGADVEDAASDVAEQGQQVPTKDGPQTEGVEVDDDENDVTEQAGQTSELMDDAIDQASQSQKNQQQSKQWPQQQRRGGSLLSGAKNLAGKASGLAGKANGSANKAKDSAGKVSSTAGKVTQDPAAATQDAKQNVKDAPEDIEQTAQSGVNDAQGAAGDTANQAKGAVNDAESDVKDTADDAAEKAEDVVDDAQESSKDTVEDAEGQINRAAEDAEQTANDGAEEVTTRAKDRAEGANEDVTDGFDEPKNLPVDLSILKGLEVEEDGTIYDREHKAIGRLAEGNAEDLAGYPIGDEGEILDDDGDLVGRVELLPDEIKRQLQTKREEGDELPDSADKYLNRVDSAQEDAEDDVEPAVDNLPGLEILEGLTCGVDGLVYDSDGNTIGKVTDGDPEQLQHATLNDEGEFIDEEGNIVGHADLHEEVEDLVAQGVYEPRPTADVAKEGAEGIAEEAAADDEEQAPQEEEEIEDQLPGIEALQGRELNEAGEILDEQGNLLAGIEDEELRRKIADGEIDPNDLVIDEHGQVIDADGNVLGKTELAEGAAERLAGLLDFRILDGRRVSKKGMILDDDGEEIGELTDGELASCAGQRANERGEVHDKKGQLVGHVRVIPGEAAQAATKELLEELGELGEGEGDDLGKWDTDQEQDLSALEGLRVNKKGLVLDEEGEPVAELASGDAKQCAGKKINAFGEVVDPSSGETLGQVRLLEQQPTAADGPDLSALDGYKVNKKGLVLDEEGEAIGELESGELSECAGKKVNGSGEVVDASGNVVGHVRVSGQSLEEADESQPQNAGAEEAADAQEEEIDPESQLPPLSSLEGLSVNKTGNILSSSGRIVGHLVEGDAKKLSKSGSTADAQGQFWDSRGNVIGRAETVPLEDDDEEDEAPFAGLEGLHVVEEGWVQDSNGNTVGYVTEGEVRRLIGREVDEDGDILDKKGSVVGRADRYEGTEEEQEEVDLGFLKGKTVSKTGLVMGDEGVPVARLVEGNAKEMAGKKLDEQGQLWNDSGKVIGRVDLIPENEREQKPEGPFAGLEDLRVVQGGKVADGDGNVVGEIVEGNARRLVGLAVDEDGDIIDKYGNVKGRAEPLPEEEATDYSILDGLTVNKQGNVVDSNGVPYGRLVDGNAAELAGRQCDENGYIYNDTGKVVGHCEPLSEEERVAKPEGPFAGLQGLRVAKGGKVVDEDGNEVGEITEGDVNRLTGLSVDEDGDIIDKFGNTKGHAEPLVEEEQEPVDNSVLNNKTVNKQGYVVDEKGIPFGRLVEGNISELAGRKCDESGNIYGDTGKVVGRCEVLPENERVARPEGPFAGLEGLRVVKDGFVEDNDGNRAGQIVEGDPKRLVGLHVDEDGDIIDKYGNVKGHAEPWTEEEQEADLSALAGTVVNKAGYAVDGNGTIIGQISEGNVKNLIGKKVDGQGQIWDDSGDVIGRCELVHGAGSSEGPFAGFEGLQIQKDGTVTTSSGDVVGRIIEGDIKKLLGHSVDEDGDVLDKNGNSLGRAERWEPEEKERRANPMSGRRVNKEGEVRDDSGDLMGRLTSGDLGHCVGQEIDDAGNVVDVDGNKIGEVTLMEHIAEEEFEGPSEEELAEAAKREEEREIAEKMGGICSQTLERMQPICKQISEAMERADRTPKDELDEEELVNEVKPLIEEGGRILQECNGSLRGLDPDGKIAAQAKGRAGTGEATPEEYRLAETLKELTTTVVKTIDDAKKKLNDMPHAKKKLNPLWALLTQPLFQILAAVGLLLAGVLGLVGQLLNALGLGGLVNGLLGGLGINKLLSSLGLGGDDKKKGKGKKGGPLGSIPVVGGLLGGKGD